MATRRSYQDACAIARALDVVGERWALLVVRELTISPRRFSDLRRALPGASSNLLADRLRELEDRGVVSRRRLPPPAGSWVYELTERGRALEPTLLALGSWGVGVPQPPGPTTLSATSVLLFLRESARLDPQAPPATYRIQLDDGVWTIQTAAGRVRLQPGEPSRPDAALSTDPKTFDSLLADPAELADACARGDAEVGGDPSALGRLLRAVAARRPRSCRTRDSS